MVSTLNEATVASASEMVEPTQVSDAMLLAHSRAMDELPGLIFAIMTLGYIIQSVIGLTL
jgi:hypothetical protein